VWWVARHAGCRIAIIAALNLRGSVTTFPSRVRRVDADGDDFWNFEAPLADDLESVVGPIGIGNQLMATVMPRDRTIPTPQILTDAMRCDVSAAFLIDG